MTSKKSAKRKVAKILGFLGLFLILLIAFFLWRIQVPTPDVHSDFTPASVRRVKVGPDHYRVNNCWLKKNEFGIWEMYLEGAPFERGVIYGVLARELMEKQEVDFIAQIKEMIPSEFFLQVLKYFVGWFNKDMYKYIPEENLQEIYGVSLSFSDKYNFVGPKYYRILNYHGAHDIGHALTDLNVVGCTSFAVNKEFSSDSSLLIARNFDFYLGDKFAEDKLVVFVKPDSGYRFASYSWAGFTGVVSGMNEKGLTVTLNASKSDIPYSAKEPISLLAREILQYAGTVNEAVAIAEKRETFVSESLLIGSAADSKAIIIEKSPNKMDVFESDKNYLVCANHYQGEKFVKDPVNRENIRSSDSKYRFDRMNELMRKKLPLDYLDAAEILRDKNGLNDQFIGYGNSKSLNQLIAHHGILFKPEQNRLWISTQPYQIGDFVCYDLDSVFSRNGANSGVIKAMQIPSDPFLATKEFKDYEAFKKTKLRIQKYVMFGKKLALTPSQEEQFIRQNPKSYVTYLVLGNYYEKKGEPINAIKKYEKSLACEVASENEREVIKKHIADCKKLTEK